MSAAWQLQVAAVLRAWRRDEVSYLDAARQLAQLGVRDPFGLLART